MEGEGDEGVNRRGGREERRASWRERLGRGREEVNGAREGVAVHVVLHSHLF